MEEKKAMEIWDYIDEHQDQKFVDIAAALDISEACAEQCSLMWAIKARKFCLQEELNSAFP